MDIILKWGVSVVFIANTPRYKSRVRVIPRLAMTVNELHVFLSSQPWNKKENARSKGSKSGKRCTRACTSYVASGVEKAKLRGHLQCAGYCILSPLRLE